MPMVSSDGARAATGVGGSVCSDAHAWPLLRVDDDGDRAAAVRSLVLGAAGDVDLGVADEAGEHAADEAAGVAGGGDVANRRAWCGGSRAGCPVEPASALASSATSRARSPASAGPARRGRARPARRAPARRRWRRAITAWSIAQRAASSRAPCPSTTISWSVSSTPAEVRGARRRRARSRGRSSSSSSVARVDLAERDGDAERRGAARQAHGFQRVAGGGRPRRAPRPRRSRSAVSSGHLIWTKWTSAGSSMPASRHRRAHAVGDELDLRQRGRDARAAGRRCGRGRCARAPAARRRRRRRAPRTRRNAGDSAPSVPPDITMQTRSAAVARHAARAAVLQRAAWRSRG